MKVTFYETYAFTSLSQIASLKEAKGNPTIICYSETLLPDGDMEIISRITSSPMTTFLCPSDHEDVYDIRFFSPNGTRVDICGHATLATTGILHKETGKNHFRVAPQPSSHHFGTLQRKPPSNPRNSAPCAAVKFSDTR